MNDDQRAAVHARVDKSRTRQQLPATVSDEAACARIARLLRPLNDQRPAAATERTIPPSTGSGLVVDPEHPRPSNADALRRGVPDPEGDDRGANPRVQEYAATRP